MYRVLLKGHKNNISFYSDTYACGFYNIGMYLILMNLKFALLFDLTKFDKGLDVSTIQALSQLYMI